MAKNYNFLLFFFTNIATPANYFSVFWDSILWTTEFLVKTHSYIRATPFLFSSVLHDYFELPNDLVILQFHTIITMITLVHNIQYKQGGSLPAVSVNCMGTAGGKQSESPAMFVMSLIHSPYLSTYMVFVVVNRAVKVQTLQAWRGHSKVDWLYKRSLIALQLGPPLFQNIHCACALILLHPAWASGQK